jgi:hypothetical protein
LEEAFFLILSGVDNIDNRCGASAFDSAGVGGGHLIPEGFVEAGRGFDSRLVSGDELAKSGQVSSLNDL